MKMTHNDLARNGLVVVGDEILPIQTPDSSWDLESLTAYAKREIGEFAALSKRTTVHMFRAGHALSLIRQVKKQDREWVKWQKENGLPPTSVNDAIRLYEAAGSEAAVTDLPLMEAYDKFGIQKRVKTARLGAGRPQGTQALERSGELARSEEEPDIPDQQNEDENDRIEDMDGNDEPAEMEEECDDPESLEAVEDEAFRQQQAALREETPLTTATAIRNALVLLLDRLAEQPTCEDCVELGDIFREIAELADAAGWECANEQAVAV